jgi:hypothetical protein
MDGPKSVGVQLLENRAVLRKVNAIVRRNSERASTEVPAEWDPAVGPAYRLLVGPGIASFLSPQRAARSPGVAASERSRHSYGAGDRGPAKLRASRLRAPLEPLAPANLDALAFPGDLIPQPLPRGAARRYDLLGRPRRQRRVVRPALPAGTEGDLASEVWASVSGNLSRLQTMRDLGCAPDAALARAEEEEAAPERAPEPPAPVEDAAPTRSISRRVQRASGDKSRFMIRWRSYFYVLRCWARYRINARIKGAFVLDVDRSRMALSIFHKWHRYVRKVRILRILHAKTQANWNHHRENVAFCSWKRKTIKAILHARLAARAWNAQNERLLKRVLTIFSDVVRSRKMARRETAKFFRFKPGGPFTPVNDYYTLKREINIRALHYDYVKRIPPYLKHWRKRVLLTKLDNSRIASVHVMRRGAWFRDWLEIFRDHFHARVLGEVRRRALTVKVNNAKKEREAADRVEKSLMLQLVRNRQVLNTKLTQFDRLSQNHSEAVMRRSSACHDIRWATNEFFKRQEEIHIVDFAKHAIDVQVKCREVRLQLAQGFLYHLGRAVRSYDNQVIAHQFCLAFRILSDPVVQRAAGYFCEKRSLKAMLGSVVRQRSVLRAVTKCATLYHRGIAWGWFKVFMSGVTERRSDGVMVVVRRRVLLLKLFPYFNWTDVLPVKPPRPLHEIEQLFKDLPPVSIERKLARERAHHLNVRQLLGRRRIMRDYFRAYASFVQVQRASRAVIKLLRARQNLRLCHSGYIAFLQNRAKDAKPMWTPKPIEDISYDLATWFKHFFRERARQQQLLQTLPYS